MRKNGRKILTNSVTECNSPMSVVHRDKCIDDYKLHRNIGEDTAVNNVDKHCRGMTRQKYTT